MHYSTIALFSAVLSIAHLASAQASGLEIGQLSPRGLDDGLESIPGKAPTTTNSDQSDDDQPVNTFGDDDSYPVQEPDKTSETDEQGTPTNEQPHTYTTLPANTDWSKIHWSCRPKEFQNIEETDSSGEIAGECKEVSGAGESNSKGSLKRMIKRFFTA